MLKLVVGWRRPMMIVCKNICDLPITSATAVDRIPVGTGRPKGWRLAEEVEGAKPGFALAPEEAPEVLVDGVGEGPAGKLVEEVPPGSKTAGGFSGNFQGRKMSILRK